MEIWDAYDRNGNKLDVDLIRGEKVPEGMYHMVCEVIVRHASGDFLLMQRDFNKPNFPGEFELTAGGSALKGESVEQCIKRELLEETGISGDNFILFDKIIDDNHKSIYYEFSAETDCRKDSVKLQKGETISCKWVNKNELLLMIDRGEVVEVVKKRKMKYFNCK